MRLLMLIVCLAFSTNAMARVHQYWVCQLNEGKTLQEAFDVMQATRNYQKENGVPYYEAGIMTPWHGNSDLPDRAFMTYAILDDFKALGNTYGSLWDEGKAYGAPNMATDVFTCTSDIRLFWEPNSMRLK